MSPFAGVVGDAPFTGIFSEAKAVPDSANVCFPPVKALPMSKRAKFEAAMPPIFDTTVDD